MLPTFIGIGAQRAGTTWAYNCLAEHPDVFMTRKKELHFFYVNYERGLEWYQEQFRDAGTHAARGEITPDYMYHEKALRNIARDVPRARIFAILRNPIDRAISAFALHEQRFAGMTFREACAAEPELIDRGHYFRHLQTVFQYLPRDQVSILLYDDLVSQPRAFVRDLYRAVGVDEGFVPGSLRVRYNRVIYPRLQRALLGMRLGWLIDAVKQTPLGDWVRRSNTADRRESGVATEGDLLALRNEFRDDIGRLSTMLRRDLSHWLA